MLIVVAADSGHKAVKEKRCTSVVESVELQSVCPYFTTMKTWLIVFAGWIT